MQLYGHLAIKLYCKSETIALQQPAYKHTDTDCQLTDRMSFSLKVIKLTTFTHFYDLVYTAKNPKDNKTELLKYVTISFHELVLDQSFLF